MGSVGNQQERQSLLKSLKPVSPDSSSDALAQKTENKLAKDATYAEVLILELQSIIDHRKLWSKVLLCLVSLIIISDMAIIFFTGFGLMKFEGEGTLPLFIASNLAQIFTLSFIVVKFLFKTNLVKEKGEELKK